MTLNAKLKILSDYTCPFSYFSLAELAVVEKRGVVVRRFASQLVPRLPMEGLPINEYDRIRGYTPEVRERNDSFLKETATACGLPWAKRGAIYQTKPAHIFAKWAQQEGVPGERVHREVFIAWYGRGENIAQTAVLEEVAKNLSLPPARVAGALASNDYQAAVESDFALQWAILYLKQHVLVADEEASVVEAKSVPDHARLAWLKKEAETEWAKLRTHKLPNRLRYEELFAAVEVIRDWVEHMSERKALIPNCCMYWNIFTSTATVIG